MKRSIRGIDWKILGAIAAYDILAILIAQEIDTHFSSELIRMLCVFAFLGSGLMLTILGIGASISRNGADSQELGDPS